MCETQSIYALCTACGGTVDPGLGSAILCGAATVSRVLKEALFPISMEKLSLESVEWSICCHPLTPHCHYPLGKVLLPIRRWVWTLNHGHSLLRSLNSQHVHNLSDRMHRV